jgi:hypothetical protein
MTYAQLIEALGTIPFDRLKETVTVFDPDRGDFCAINHLELADEKTNDVLDAGHAYLVLKSYGF